LSKVALDSAAAEIEPATSSRKSNALTTAPPSHTINKRNLVSWLSGKSLKYSHQMSHFKAKMHEIRFLSSVCLSLCLFVCVLDGVWHKRLVRGRTRLWSGWKYTAEPYIFYMCAVGLFFFWGGGHLPEVSIQPAVEKRINGRRADGERLEQQVDKLEVGSTDWLAEELGQQRVDVPRSPTDNKHRHDADQNTRCYMPATLSYTRAHKSSISMSTCSRPTGWPKKVNHFPIDH